MAPYRRVKMSLDQFATICAYEGVDEYLIPPMVAVFFHNQTMIEAATASSGRVTDQTLRYHCNKLAETYEKLQTAAAMLNKLSAATK